MKVLRLKKWTLGCEVGLRKRVMLNMKRYLQQSCGEFQGTPAGYCKPSFGWALVLSLRTARQLLRLMSS